MTTEPEVVEFWSAIEVYEEDGDLDAGDLIALRYEPLTSEILERGSTLFYKYHAQHPRWSEDVCCRAIFATEELRRRSLR